VECGAGAVFKKCGAVRLGEVCRFNGAYHSVTKVSLVMSLVDCVERPSSLGFTQSLPNYLKLKYSKCVIGVYKCRLDQFRQQH